MLRKELADILLLDAGRSVLLSAAGVVILSSLLCFLFLSLLELMLCVAAECLPGMDCRGTGGRGSEDTAAVTCVVSLLTRAGGGMRQSQAGI